jgi:hypothetical protein
MMLRIAAPAPAAETTVDPEPLTEVTEATPPSAAIAMLIHIDAAGGMANI